MEEGGGAPAGSGGRWPWAQRAVYWFDNTLAGGTYVLVGWLVVACLSVVLPVSAVLVWTDGRAPASLSGKLAEVWRSTGQTLRLGGEVGPAPRIALSVLLALVTLLYVSTLVSLITTGISERLLALRRGRSPVLERRHAVVLGWSEQVFTVVSELVRANANQRRAAVAVLADRGKTEMQDALDAKVGPTGRTRLICRSGRLTDPDDLTRVGPATADSVIVLPRDSPSEDGEVVKTLLALRAAVGDDSGVRVVAAVRDDRYRLAATLAAGPDAAVLEIDDITARLVARAARQPGLSLVHQELLDFEGVEFYTVDEPALLGRPFGETLLAHASSCVVGLVRDGGALALNPSPDTVLGPGDRLVVIAEDDDTTVLSDVCAAVDPAVIVDRPPVTARPERILLLGWNRRATRIVTQLARYTPPGSVLDVVADGGKPTAAAVRSAAAEAAPSLAVLLRRGDPTRPETLDGVDAASYDSVIVLGPDHRPGHDEPDDRTLVTLLLLRAIERASGREIPVVTEMTDDRNRVLAPVSAGSDFIVSGKLVGLLMSQISQNRHLAGVFEELFSPDGNGLHLRPAGHYVRPGCETAFATVVESARRRGECAVGYRSAPDRRTGDDHGVRVNPAKTAVRRWTAHDEVIVLAAD
ncbi:MULTISPECIES: CASTOR/POLLUX-related putative ion channel [Streptomyces]|uniref:NAD-binding lipoprotein n=2 Tax=Streptomyces TaxID=1883 RepID=A0A100YA94_9ACTN|nr:MULTISPECIES: TrkA C-terminal domain-containing protein [Streptomyces]KUH40468.1 NAD-binding lipoprotein [Streptomyces kanasensis]UUS34672.1 NAD-binding lipoprotein [Streptomyces changanensis]